MSVVTTVIFTPLHHQNVNQGGGELSSEEELKVRTVTLYPQCYDTNSTTYGVGTGTSRVGDKRKRNNNNTLTNTDGAKIAPDSDSSSETNDKSSSSSSLSNQQKLSIGQYECVLNSTEENPLRVNFSCSLKTENNILMTNSTSSSSSSSSSSDEETIKKNHSKQSSSISNNPRINRKGVEFLDLSQTPLLLETGDLLFIQGENQECCYMIHIIQVNGTKDNTDSSISNDTNATTTTTTNKSSSKDDPPTQTNPSNNPPPHPQSDPELRSTFETSKEQLQHEMKCNICMEIMVNSQVLNPCGHVVCGDCASKLDLKSKRKRSICPTCRTIVQNVNPIRCLDNIIWHSIIRGAFNVSHVPSPPPSSSSSSSSSGVDGTTTTTTDHHQPGGDAATRELEMEESMEDLNCYLKQSGHENTMTDLERQCIFGSDASSGSNRSPSKKRRKNRNHVSTHIRTKYMMMPSSEAIDLTSPTAVINGGSSSNDPICLD